MRHWLADMRRAGRPAHRWLTVSRRTLGLFYLAMALGVNVSMVLPAAREVMDGFAGDAWIPPYQDLLEALIVPNAVAVAVLVIGFESAIGAILLTGTDRLAAWAALAGAAWCVGLLPALLWPYIAPMPLLIAAQLWLFSRLRSAAAEPGVAERIAEPAPR